MKRVGVAIRGAWGALLIAATPWATIPSVFMPLFDKVATLLPVVPVVALAASAVGWRRVGVVLPALAALVLAGIPLAREWPRTAHPAGTRLVVVSHNVWVNNADPAGTIDRLAKGDADVLLLQEVDGTVAPFLARLRVRYPFGSRCSERCSAAILSRWPTERVRYRFRDDAGRPYGPGLVQTRIRVPGVPVPVPVASIHLSRRLSADQLARDSRALATALARPESQAAIVAGDFNLSGFSPGMSRLDSALFPLERTTRSRFTYPARLAGLAWPVPLAGIDHVFAGPRWAAASTRVLPATGSDHRPIRVELVWQD